MIGAWAQVVLGRYCAALDSGAVEQAVAIRMRGGGEVLPTAVEQAPGSGDHREAVLFISSSLRSGSVLDPRER